MNLSAEAFEKRVLLVKDRLFRAARCVTRNDADAEDAVLEAIYRAYLQREQLRNVDAFPAWVMRITVRESCRILQKRRGERPLDDAEEAAVESPYEAGELMSVVEQLPLDLRLPVLLFYYEDMRQKDVARALGLPEGTVASRLHRARERLRGMLS